MSNFRGVGQAEATWSLARSSRISPSRIETNDSIWARAMGPQYGPDGMYIGVTRNASGNGRNSALACPSAIYRGEGYSMGACQPQDNYAWTGSASRDTGFFHQNYHTWADYDAHYCGKRLDTIAAPSQAMNVCENAGGRIPFMGATWVPDALKPFVRHLDSGNVVFFDGHVQSIPYALAASWDGADWNNIAMGYYRWP
jgi:prepilin-type processing-associated H-X9-DG protein